MIKMVLLDIDGVLTDGKVTVDFRGKETKTIDFRDIDAVFAMKRQKLLVGLLTGERTPITLFFKKRFQPDFFYNGCKDKLAALQKILKQTKLSTEEVCYVGDSKHDILAMKSVKFSACPSSAISEVKAIATIQLSAHGGDGCVWELWERITLMEKKSEK